MRNALLGLGMAGMLALGGVGAAELASGADHSHPSRRQPAVTAPDLGHEHRDGMKRWQACHRDGGAHCVKPAPPGWLKHPEKHPGGWPPKDHKDDEAGGTEDRHGDRDDRD